MASYKYDSESYSRPSTQRSRRMGTIVPPTYLRAEEPKPDAYHIPKPIDPRKASTVAEIQPITFPRRGLQVPSPTEPVPEKSSGRSSNWKKGTDRLNPQIWNAPLIDRKSSPNLLRRKPSSISQYAENRKRGVEWSANMSRTGMDEPRRPVSPRTEASLKSEDAYNAIFTHTRKMAPADQELPPVIPELDRYRLRLARSPERMPNEFPFRIATNDLPPPTPQISGSSTYHGMSSDHRYSAYSGSGYSASPSVGFSDSPGPGAFSRNTTPTSITSQSPSIMAPVKIATPKLYHGNGAMNRSGPPVTRKTAGSESDEIRETNTNLRGLPALRESSKVENRKNGAPTSPPPTPPPRKSSQKFTQLQTNDHGTPVRSKSPLKATDKLRAVTSPDVPTSKLSKTSSHAIGRSASPTRPSRKGTPDLHSQIGPSVPVIQGNLNNLNISLRRSPTGSPQPTASSSTKLPEYRPTKSRLPFPNLSQRSYREATSAPNRPGNVPTLLPMQTPYNSRNVSRPPSPNVSRSRFGFFRRTKPAVVEETEKEGVLRKGPAAGTGHEGYGRFGLRGRSGAGRAEQTRRLSSSSQTSATSNDPFLLERMNPVIIAGGGEIVENRNATGSELSRTESNQSLTMGRTSLESKDSWNPSLSQSQNNSRMTLSPAISTSDSKKIPGSNKPVRRQSESSEEFSKISSLPMQRSMRGVESNSGTQLRRPIDVSTVATSPAIENLNRKLLSDQRLETRPDGRKAQLKETKKLGIRAPSPKKWKLFHRTKLEAKPEADPKEDATVKVILGRPVIKPVPHYAMLDSSDEQSPEGFDMEEVMRDSIEPVTLSNEELDALQFAGFVETSQRITNLQDLLASPTPDPAVMALEDTPLSPPQRHHPLFYNQEDTGTPEILQGELMPHSTPQKSKPRPSRLQQVGRIPKVVSARPEATSPKSFSRPFAGSSTLQPSLIPTLSHEDSVAKGFSSLKPTRPKPLYNNEIFSSTVADFTTQRPGSVRSQSESISDPHEFLVFPPPRKDSEATTSSSSGPARSYDGTAAVVPDPSAALVEDEIWDEYNDLIEHDDTSQEPLATISSHSVPFQHKKHRSRPNEANSKSNEAHLGGTMKQTKLESLSAHDSVITATSVYSQDASPQAQVDPNLETPMSLNEFFVGSNSPVQGSRRGSGECRKFGPSRNYSCQSRSPPVDTAEEQGSISAHAQVNLRVGSMTVSKWLTFGHVLFSPAREDVMNLAGISKHHSILIIDGLGNDDWSFYAAETYPNATIYNLSRSRPLTRMTSARLNYPLTPPNHRQVHHPSPSTKFPFPSSTFLVVIIRFPTCMPESHYRILVSEARRVLKPGGYLEMAILDLDMTDMGPRARRQVRGLKEGLRRMDDGALALGSASDIIMRCVARRGFTGVKSCRVGVPVACTVEANSSSDSHSEQSQRASMETDKGKATKEEPSLSQMLSDPSPKGDMNISRMVAKVGRWWYYRCYESILLATPTSPTVGSPKAKGKPYATELLARRVRDGSVFDDPAILAECNSWNSSFKLVVAYAQKPVEPVGRRRTASV